MCRRPESPPVVCKSGFTLLELLLAASLAVIVLVSFVNGFNQQQQVLKRKKLEQEMQFNVRNAISFLERDLAKAGSGLVMGEQNIPIWFTSLSGVTRIPHVVEGGADPDRVILAGTLDGPVASLDGAVSAGAVSITLSPVTGNAFTYSPQSGDVLVLAGVEPMLVTGISGNQITIKTDPTKVSAGLELDYPDGVDIFLVSVVEYGIETIEGVAGLIREDSRYTYSSTEDRLVAEGIEDLQLSISRNVVSIDITGKTRHPVLNYSGEPDEHPRYTLSSNVKVQVNSPQLSISAWPEYAMVATATPVPTATPTPSATTTAVTSLTRSGN